MNRQQAEHLLDACIEMELIGADNNARSSLREVILDAMTEYRQTAKQSGMTYPCITLPATSYPTNWYGSPKVTCSGIDPLFKQTTGVDA